MSPQLQQILVQAQQLNHTEQLQLINLLVNHALPLPPDAIATPSIDAEILDDVEGLESTAPSDADVAASGVTPLDPQCAEFLDEITQYRREHQE